MKKSNHYYTVLLPLAFGVGLIVQALADTQFKGLFVFVAIAVVAVFKPIFFTEKKNLNGSLGQDESNQLINYNSDTTAQDESYIAGVNGATGLPTFNGVDTSGNADGTRSTFHDPN